MTLIVARKLRRTLRLFCDSKITDVHAVSGGYLTGALKAVVLDRYTCIAFAGNVYPALMTLRALDARRSAAGVEGLSAEDVVADLEGAVGASDGTTQFLLASLRPPCLAAVRKDGVEWADQLWIGDADAFAAYQRHFHEPSGMYWRVANPTLDPARIAAFAREKGATTVPRLRAMGYWDEDTIQDWVMSTRLKDAMIDVIADPSVPSVDELAVAVAASDDGFRYEPLVSISMSSPEDSATTQGQQDYDGGTAASGGFTYSICVPRQAGVGAVGVHFRQPRLGALFHPLRAGGPIIYRDVGESAFRSEVARTQAIDLQAAMLG